MERFSKKSKKNESLNLPYSFETSGMTFLFLTFTDTELQIHYALTEQSNKEVPSNNDMKVNSTVAVCNVLPTYHMEIKFASSNKCSLFLSLSSFPV